MVFRQADEVRDLNSKARAAVELAMSGRWQEAAEVNREVISVAPSNLDAYNRLGKALLELGDTQAARAAFEHSLAIDPTNPIAKKNVERLSSGTASSGSAPLSHKMFIGETGKSAQVALLGCAVGSARPSLAPGSAIELRVHKGNLVVYSGQGKYVGIVPPRIGHRLVPLMEGGNQYGGAVVSTSVDSVRVVLHESYQHPSLRSKMSFPATAAAPAGAAAPAPTIDTADLMDDPEPVQANPVAETPAEELREVDGPDADLDASAEANVEFTDAVVELDDDGDDAGEDEEAVEHELEEAI